MSRPSSGSVLVTSIYANSQPQTSVEIGFISLAFSFLKLRVNVRMKTYKEKGQNCKERTGEEENFEEEYEVKVETNRRIRRLWWR
jgi:hypothetical protein